jgi:hypothetical protein
MCSVPCRFGEISALIQFSSYGKKSHGSPAARFAHYGMKLVCPIGKWSPGAEARLFLGGGPWPPQKFSTLTTNIIFFLVFFFFKYIYITLQIHSKHNRFKRKKKSNSKIANPPQHGNPTWQYQSKN